MDKDIQTALNEQIRHEFTAAYLYLGMMAWFETRSLPGFGHWMRLQAQEELAHAMKLVDFVLDRGGKVELGDVAAPGIDFESPHAVMKAALEHERRVTGLINRVYALASAKNDYPAQVLMQWFVAEQVEEEKNAGEIADQLAFAGDSASAILVLDGRLAARQPGEGDGGEG
ncbi:MAG: ferritin [Gemmatimonadetes bacterium]|nr:ferritin [Gemmatimonadota bacterium]